MAFCTTCGATVQGAFCQQCGTPAKAAAAQPAAPPAPPPGAPPYTPPVSPVAAAPVRKGLSPIVWILLVFAGLVVLGVLGLGVGVWYLARNPGVALAKIITAANPDAEVLNTDLGSQTVRIRDRRTGKEVTLSFDDIKKGRMRFSATGDNGEVANVEIGGGEGKMPSWVPAYPGAKAQGNMTASGESKDGIGEGGVVTFTTTDSPSKVTSYYDAKFKDLGLTVDMTQVTDAGGMIIGHDEGNQRTLHVLVAGGSGDTTITVTYGRKK